MKSREFIRNVLFLNIVKSALLYISFAYSLNLPILHIHPVKPFGFDQNDIPTHSKAILDLLPKMNYGKCYISVIS